MLFPFRKQYWKPQVTAITEAEVVPGDKLAELQHKSHQEASLIVHKLSKSYKTTTAVKEVSMSLQPGRIYTLLGVNGSGKSSLLGMLVGRISPSHGQAFLEGVSVNDHVKFLQPRIGVCMQDDYLYDNLTALETF